MSETKTVGKKAEKVEKPDVATQLRQQVSQKDRVIQALRAEITEHQAERDKAGQEVLKALARLTAMTMLLQRRDEVIALSTAMSERLLELYQPKQMEFVNQEIAAMHARLAARSKAIEIEDAERNENRT